MILNNLTSAYKNRDESKNLISAKRKINSMKKHITSLSSEEKMELLHYLAQISTENTH